MSKLEIDLITYKGKKYPSVTIDDVLGGSDETITIASSSLNEALVPDDGDYADETARHIDEQIYSFIDDEFFDLSREEFIEKVKEYLD